MTEDEDPYAIVIALLHIVRNAFARKMDVSMSLMYAEACPKPSRNSCERPELPNTWWPYVVCSLTR